MNSGHIGRAGLLVILILIVSYLSDIFNWDSLFMGEITYTKGYITNKQVVPFGRSASYKLFYTYTIEGQLFEDSYYSNKRISKVEIWR
ncbi:hypothetical protein R9C00_03295 [Flammeovirgaceae bacterium SG7u.111]|nr:hypothetical protein [Flammeovirgaceae bacterium SG7u.132]WPO36468.1 hypothetical protein R9C00_03295 [Flammeovirgaceae bacterium SG7u.111]